MAFYNEYLRTDQINSLKRLLTVGNLEDHERRAFTSMLGDLSTGRKSQLSRRQYNWVCFALQRYFPPDSSGDYSLHRTDADEKHMVYFAQAGETGNIKIGYTSNISSRIAGLQNGCPEPIRLLLTIPGGLGVERQLHHRFAAHRAIGEWFKPADELLAFIAEKKIAA